MSEYEDLMDLVFDNLKVLLYPQEWTSIDLEFSKSELFALLIVDRHREVIMSKIAEYINAPMSTANGIIERLVKKGYLDRDRSETDRRIVVIRLTEEGKSLVNGLKNIVLEYIKLIYDALDDEERRLIFKIFDKITRIIAQKDSTGKTDISGDQLKKIPIE